MCGSGSSGAPAGIPAPVPAAITAQPLAVTVADGGTPNFTVVATGAAPLVYQWQRNGVALIDAVGIVGALTQALTLIAPYAFNGSQIAVSVSNAAGKILSGAAMLTVTAVAPSIVLQPANTSVTSGSAASFSVTIKGGTSPETYQWKRDGSVIAGATAASYTLAAAAPSDSGAIFTVDVINPAGILTSASATLTVMASALMLLIRK